MAHYALGNIEEADRALDELIETGSANAAYQIAEVYGMRGDANKAFEWLERAFTNRDSGIANLLDDKSFSSISTDERWEPMLERLGLAQVWRNLPPEWGGPS